MDTIEGAPIHSSTHSGNTQALCLRWRASVGLSASARWPRAPSSCSSKAQALFEGEILGLGEEQLFFQDFSHGGEVQLP